MLQLLKLGCIAIVLFGGSVAQACSCWTVTSPGPCSGLGSDGLLFVGTVVSISPERPREVQTDGSIVEYFGGDRHVKLTVDERFVGAIGNDIDVTTGSGGGDCGYPFEVGRTYLVSASEWKGNVYTSICSVTAPIEEAGHLVAQYRRLKEGKRAASIYGRLVQDADDPFTHESVVYRPLSDVSVRLHYDNHDVSTTTDASGGFAFYDLTAGKYVATADIPDGYALRTSKSENVINLDSGACAVANLVAGPTGTIRGIVTDEDGLPLSGMAVVLKRPENQPRKLSEHRRFETTPTRWTDALGRFEFGALPDGDFQVVIRTATTEKARAPYQPRVLGTPSGQPEATIIVRNGSTVDLGSVQLTSWKDQYRARFLVLWKDGMPATGATVYSTTVPHSNDSARSSETVDGDGRATIPLLSEYEYEVSAEVECRDDSLRESPPTKVTKGEIRLMIEGEKCEPKEEDN